MHIRVRSHGVRCGVLREIILALFALACAGRIAAQEQKTVFVVPTQNWTDTGLSVFSGQQIVVNATGELNWYTGGCPAGQNCITTPDGNPAGGCSPMVPAPKLTCWSLIGRIGVNGTPFQVGSHLSYSVPSGVSGEFYLGVNDYYLPDNTGGWTAIVSVSAQLPTCASNATIDFTKIRVTPSALWGEWSSNDNLYIQPGTPILIPYLFNGPPFGITIEVEPGAVTFNGTSPTGVTFKFIQDLNGFTGYATYQELNGQPYTERQAILAELSPNGSDLTGPLVDDDGHNPPYYNTQVALEGQSLSLIDSPGVHAPLNDNQGRPLAAMHYTKTFTAYYGCHTTADLTAYSSTDSRHYLHTIAKVTWHVNYFGKVSHCVFCRNFEPDTGTDPATNAGVFYNQPEPSLDEEIVVAPPRANVATNYICFTGGVCR